MGQDLSTEQESMSADFPQQTSIIEHGTTTPTNQSSNACMDKSALEVCLLFIEAQNKAGC
jgi:hypothetical protein